MQTVIIQESEINKTSFKNSFKSWKELYLALKLEFEPKKEEISDFGKLEPLEDSEITKEMRTETKKLKEEYRKSPENFVEISS